MSDSVEKLFRKALEEVTVEPPARVWEGICAHFDMKRRRQRRLFWYGGVAAAVALLLAIGLVVRDGAEGRLSPTPLAENGRHIIHLEDNKVAAVMSSVASIPPFGRRGAETERLTPMDNGEGIALALAGETGRRELKNGRTRELSIRLVNGEAVENQKKYLALLNESATDNQKKATRQPKEETVTSQSIQTPKEETREKPERAPRERKNREAGRFSVGGYVSPGYTSGTYHQSNTTSRSAQFSDEQMSGLFNVTGGVNFSVRPTKRISIETGVGYSRMGQRTDEMSVYAPSVTMSAKDGDKVVTSNVQVATPLGNVKSKAQAAVYTMDANIALKDADMPEGSIEQQFDAIEIPLLFRYRLNDNRVRFSVVGGFGASFMVRNETRLTYDGITESMGETDGIRKFNISTNLGLGMEYPITKAISFKVEPGFKYYLQSLSKNSDIDFKPYTFTFSTGIGINF